MASSYQPPPPPGPGAVPRKKTSPIVWILVAVGGFFLLCILAFAALVGYGVHKARQAGFDTALMKKNPALATAKMAATLNKDLQVVSSDDDRGTMTVRDKNTGKVTTMTFDSKEGKFVVSEEGKEASTVTFGGGAAQIPSWLPDYPGSKPEAAMTGRDANGESGVYHFKTKDSPDQVTKFYEDKLKSSGMKITSSFSGQSAGSTGGMMTAEDDAKHNVLVTVGTEGSDTTVAVTYSTKK